MAMPADYGSPRFSPSSSITAARSPDTTSPIYPDRAIRPLPRSRLKSKLSPEQVTNIVYPPDPVPVSPTLHFSGAAAPIHTPHARVTNGINHGRQHSHVPAHEHCTCGEEDDSGDDEVEFDHPDYRYATAMPATLNGITSKSAVQRKLLESSRPQMRAPGPASTASSADGYESFENTSNKKKRKIPLSAASSMHQSSLSAEMASMGINNGEREQEESMHQYHGSAGASSPLGTGISGAGRGRFGRQIHKYERRPLATSMNAVHGYNARLPRASVGGKPPDNGVENADGIISQAIKTATEHRPLVTQEDRDNVSLLQSAATATTPKSQFTFACESESASKMAGQQAAAAAAAAAYASNVRNHGQQSSQTSQLRHGPVHPGMNGRPPPPPAPVGQPPASAVNPPRPKPRRRLSRDYALAARQRQLQQEYANYHNRPAKGDMYICEFCEYEDIFGAPPMAMIRRYEAKDRDERKKAAERRRLLEKAKMKSRKGKKNKGGKNNNHGGQVTNNHGQNTYDPDAPPDHEGDEYYDDEEYGDEYDPVDGEHYDEAPPSNAFHPPPALRSGIVPPVATPNPAMSSVGRPPPMAPT